MTVANAYPKRFVSFFEAEVRGAAGDGSAILE
jgi:hypothetical protein